MNVLRIVDWEKHFENNRTRELKFMTWVPFPNKHDGHGYGELLDHKDGPSHYAAWVALVQVASKCEPRGTLLRDGRTPHDSRSLAMKTRIPAKVFDAAIPRLLENEWLERIPFGQNNLGDTPQAGAGIPQDDATGPHDGAPRVRARPEGNCTEGTCPELDGTESKESRLQKTFDQFWEAYPRKKSKGDGQKAWKAAVAKVEKRTGDFEAACAYLLERTALFAKSDEGQSGEFCRYPATWLNAESFDDDPDTWRRGNGNRNGTYRAGQSVSTGDRTGGFGVAS